MKNKLTEIRIQVNPTVLKRLKEEQIIDKYNKKTISAIVREALDLYFQQKDYPSGSVTQGDMDTIKKTLKEGLIIPEVEEKPKQDKDIKPAFTIQPGPGAHMRLRSINIDPQKVINARRAKNAGRDYDQELEKYFNLL